MYYPVPKFDFLAKKPNNPVFSPESMEKLFILSFNGASFSAPLSPRQSHYDYAPAQGQVQRRIPACPKGKAGIKTRYFFIICKGIYSTISVRKMPSTAVR